MELTADQKHLQWQQSYQRVRRESAVSASVAESEAQALSRRLAKLREDEKKQTVTAPLDGVVADRPTDMHSGEVMAAGEWLTTVVSGETTGVKPEFRSLRPDKNQEGKIKTALIPDLMRACGLKPLPRMGSLKELGSCLHRRFLTPKDAIPEVRLVTV